MASVNEQHLHNSPHLVVSFNQEKESANRGLQDQGICKSLVLVWLNDYLSHPKRAPIERMERLKKQYTEIHRDHLAYTRRLDALVERRLIAEFIGPGPNGKVPATFVEVGEERAQILEKLDPTETLDLATLQVIANGAPVLDEKTRRTLQNRYDRIEQQLPIIQAKIKERLLELQMEYGFNRESVEDQLKKLSLDLVDTNNAGKWNPDTAGVFPRRLKAGECYLFALKSEISPGHAMAIAIESRAVGFMKLRFFDPNEGEFYGENSFSNTWCDQFFCLLRADYAKFRMSQFTLYKVVRK